MRRNLLQLLVPVLAAVLASCSGLPQTGGGGGGTGNGSVILTLSANPLTPPPNTSILSFAVTITGVALTPSTGTAVSISLPASSLTFDLTRLQSDSAFLASTSASIPAGTYTGMTVSLSSSVTFCTQLNPGTAGCASGSVATVTGTASVPAITSSITITANQTESLRIQIDLSKALTINSSTQVISAVNLGATGVFSTSALPPTASSLATGQLDFVEDFTGIVTAVSGSSVTVTTTKHGAITAVANSSTFFSPNCTNFGLTTDITCVKQNQLASIDAAVKSDGTFTLLDYDPLATTASDWIEGVVTSTPSSSTQFQIVANDAFLAASGSLVGSTFNLSDVVTANLALGANLDVDTRGLILPAEATTFQNANDTSVLRPGQTVAVHVTAFTAKSGTTPASVTSDAVLLRFTRVTGSVSSTSPPNVFFLNNLAAFFGTTIQLKVQLNQAAAPQTAPTNFDGADDASGLTTSQTVSIRALYFGSASATPFTTTKVRAH